MKNMYDYIHASGKTGIGFCRHELINFYKNCGFEVIPKGINYFHYKIPSSYPDSDAFYIKGKDALIDEILSNPDEVAEISRRHW